MASACDKKDNGFVLFIEKVSVALDCLSSRSSVDTAKFVSW